MEPNSLSASLFVNSKNKFSKIKLNGNEGNMKCADGFLEFQYFFTIV